MEIGARSGQASNLIGTRRLAAPAWPRRAADRAVRRRLRGHLALQPARPHLAHRHLGDGREGARHRRQRRRRAGGALRPGFQDGVRAGPAVGAGSRGALLRPARLSQGAGARLHPARRPGPRRHPGAAVDALVWLGDRHPVPVLRPGSSHDRRLPRPAAPPERRLRPARHPGGAGRRAADPPVACAAPVTAAAGRGGAPGGGARRAPGALHHGQVQPAGHAARQPAGLLPLAAPHGAARRAPPARRLRPAAQSQPHGGGAHGGGARHPAARPLYLPPGPASGPGAALPAAGRPGCHRARAPVVAAARKDRRRAAQQPGRPRHEQPDRLARAEEPRRVPPRWHPLAGDQRRGTPALLQGPKARPRLSVVRPLLPRAGWVDPGAGLRSEGVGGKGTGGPGVRPAAGTAGCPSPARRGARRRG